MDDAEKRDDEAAVDEDKSDDERIPEPATPEKNHIKVPKVCTILGHK